MGMISKLSVLSRGLLVCVSLSTLDALALEPGPPPVAVHATIPDLPGHRPDGSVLLPNQWSLRPAGRQIGLGDFPVNIAVHPGGRFAAVAHSGHGKHEVLIVDLSELNVVSQQRVNECFYGLEFSHDGKHLFCSGGGDEVVHEFEFKNGQLTNAADIRLRDRKQRGIPCGLALTRDGKTLFVANVWGQRVSKADVATRTNFEDFAVQAAASTNSAAPVFPNRKSMNQDLLMITKRATAILDPTAPDAPFPYACRLDEKRSRLYVSLWARSAVAVVDLTSDEVIAQWPTGEHPNEMVLSKSGKLLFVANANHNSVTVIDTVAGQTLETLDGSLSPLSSLPGSTPESLALSPDEKTLFVSNACNNNIAVFDVSSLGKSHSLGFIPVGWYPTSVRVTPDGRHLLVANGKGLISKANPHREDIKDLFLGTLSVIDLAKGDKFKAQLATWTAQAYECTPQHSVTPPPVIADNPVPPKLGGTSPIKYCIYIIKENRTYDQVFGDIKEGNGDPEICLFPENITPNHHKLAREFVLFDNFYVDAEVSADGHEWSMGAYATDFVEKEWPLSYGHNRRGKYPHPSEGVFPIATPANGYIWDRAKEAGVSYRSYGEFVQDAKSTNAPATAKLAALKDHFDPWFRSFDTGYPDILRADRFISELKRLEAEGDMPRLQIVRLPNDHTAGTLVGSLTPRAYLADNDLALGRVVEAVSRSKFWPQTAIFVLEDDAQDGPDHVDAHRSPALIISPYTRRGVVDSTMYSTSSMLHTIELILGLKPMTQFDATATPMYYAFVSQPDTRPYESLPANITLTERNSRLSWGSSASQKMDFSKEDATDENLLNQIVWHSVRGPDTPMPAPRHAAFVFATNKDGDDD
jgi:DNA-binding beta-propeller fold protein YncE/phospholipase C